MNKRPMAEPLAVALNTPHFAISPPLTPSDPLTPTAMVRRLDEIKAYDRNPRLAANARFEEIKASIRVRGLETALPITRRPGEDRYMVSKGGNTRLKILNELFDETGEARFGQVRCEFTPGCRSPTCCWLT